MDDFKKQFHILIELGKGFFAIAYKIYNTENS
jgi:hypothetical protein